TGASPPPGVWETQKPVVMGWIHGGCDGTGLQPSDLSFVNPNLGCYPRLVSGRADGARFRKGQRAGLFEG
ncbi:MAG: hypothetical protein WCR20_01560, partial [Verrucomicrobiota bacterium]